MHVLFFVIGIQKKIDWRLYWPLKYLHSNLSGLVVNEGLSFDIFNVLDIFSVKY